VCEYAGRHSDGSAASCPSQHDIAEDLEFHFAAMGRELRDMPEQLDLWGFHGAFAEALRYLAGRHRRRRGGDGHASGSVDPPARSRVMNSVKCRQR